MGNGNTNTWFASETGLGWPRDLSVPNSALCFPQLHLQLFVLQRRAEQDKQSQRPSPPFLSGSRHRLERWWLGRKAAPRSSSSLAAWPPGTMLRWLCHCQLPREC